MIGKGIEFPIEGLLGIMMPFATGSAQEFGLHKTLIHQLEIVFRLLIVFGGFH